MTAKQLLMLTLTYYFMDAEPKADKDLILKVQLLWFMGVLGAAMMVVFQAIYLKAWVRFLNSWMQLERLVSGKNSVKHAIPKLSIPIVYYF